MNEPYVESLQNQLTLECETFGEPVEINGFKVFALVSTSPTTKSYQVAGFFKNQTMDAVLPVYGEEPKLNHNLLYRNKTYSVRQVEELEFKSGYRLMIELVP